MDTFFDRIETLRKDLLGLSQAQFCKRIKLTPQNYPAWNPAHEKPQQPGAGKITAITERWYVSRDSLFAAEGTYGLEPAPALRQAQEILTLQLSHESSPGTEGDRVILCYRLLTGTSSGGKPLLATLTPAAWAEWLHWGVRDWEAAILNPSLIGETQIEGAAFFLGWYTGRLAWASWFRSGHASELIGARDEILGALADLYARRTLDRIDLRRLIQEHSR